MTRDWDEQDKGMEATPPRDEMEIFADLENLCGRPGYVHAIAYFCYRDDVIHFPPRQFKAKNLDHQFDYKALSRAEIATLIGLLVKSAISFDLPPPIILQAYIDSTESLLLELHHALAEPMFAPLKEAISSSTVPDLSPSGLALREPIFYGDESAADFQYRTLAAKKYMKDNDWLMEKMGFHIEDACAVAECTQRLLEKQTQDTLRQLDPLRLSDFTILPASVLSPSAITDECDLPITTVQAVLDAFSIPAPPSNFGFTSVSVLSEINARPLIPLHDNRYLLFQPYTLAESVYESPYYWMVSDSSYRNQATHNRGLFTEEFSAECLVRSFGSNRVFQNVELRSGKNRGGEVDVLVIFGNRLVVLQAKSKRLTWDARNGNDRAIESDFKRSIQHAYDQAYDCATKIASGDFTLFTLDGKQIKLGQEPAQIFPICIVADHYPALAYQARRFLTVLPSEIIRPPFVMDVFFLDVLTEMLDDPLFCLSYIDRRTTYWDRVIAGHELTILSYHLVNNLWISDPNTCIHLDPSISADIDAAMLVRRKGLPGQTTPNGLLTMHRDSPVHPIFEDIKQHEHGAAIDFAFYVLQLDGNTIGQLNSGLKRICKQALHDNKSHDLSIGTGESKEGFTIHCNERSEKGAMEALLAHCQLRKHSQRADRWYGICLHPRERVVRFAIVLDGKWRPDGIQDRKLAASKIQSPLGSTSRSRSRNRRIGRNDLCPCGSGRKHKKCCLNKTPR